MTISPGIALAVIEASIVVSLAGCEQNAPAPPGNDTGVGTIVSIGEMREARALHTVTLLDDGRVLIAGGGTPETALASAEVYDPIARSSIPMTLSDQRFGHTATRLGDGRVLIVGGGYGGAPSTTSADLFDPVTNKFSRVGPTLFPRTDHAAVLLSDGRVLIVGGDPSGVGSSPLRSTELFEPATGRFVRGPDLGVPRRPYGVVRLQDGRVLVAGGTSTARQVLGSAEIYDPASNTFRLTGNMNTPSEKHTAALLPDGRVLIAGGSNGDSGSGRVARTEIFDPSTGRFSGGATMRSARHKVTSVPLPNGDVLIIGGSGELAELYRRETNQFVGVAEGSSKERFFPAAVELADGRVLITGGYTSGGSRNTIWAYSRE